MPPDKSFDLTVPFGVHSANGNSQILPIVTVSLLVPPGDWVYDVPLLFDTGASQIVLRTELYPFLGLLAPDVGAEVVEVETARGPVTAYRHQARIQAFGKDITCPVHLIPLAEHPLYQGLFGREAVFQHFGFGFWENAQALYVALTP